MKESFRKLKILFIALAVMLAISPPPRTNAQFAVIDAGNMVQNTLTAINTTASSISNFYTEYKESILDPLVWGIAKALVQSLTADIVTWINSGFEGNPAFLDNPSGFFLDAADQATGVFLSNGGPLSVLCSPFTIDIRLSLALNMGQRARTRYACTLSTVMNNIGNSSVNVSTNASINNSVQYPGSPRTRGTAGSVALNGQAITQFTTNGDFYQGGWPAFIALTTEPQNNAYGAYLQSQSDLLSEIARNQGRVTLDLQIGSGFLSSTKCEDLPPTTADGGYNQTVAENQVASGQLTKKVNSDGSVKYQRCRTVTPGSVIADGLSKHLGSSVDQLNLADEFNEIISALFGQIIRTVLYDGLGTMNTSNGTTPSYVDQIRAQDGKALAEQKQQIMFRTNAVVQYNNQYKQARDQALQLLLNVRAIYQSALDCLKEKLATDPTLGRVEDRIAEIEYVLKTKVDPQIALRQKQADAANSRFEIINRIRAQVTAATNLVEMQQPAQDFANLASQRKLTTPQDVQEAQMALQTVEKIVEDLEEDARGYANSCSSADSAD